MYTYDMIVMYNYENRITLVHIVQKMSDINPKDKRPTSYICKDNETKSLQREHGERMFICTQAKGLQPFRDN